MSTLMPTVFIPHGGGPCFFMEWTMGPADSWDRLEHWLRGYAATLPARPEAILVVSAHWEESELTVQSGASPRLLFDYYGFPRHTYELEYPAPGDPACAARVLQLLQRQGLACREDPERPFDHGVFIPLLLMFPDADIPVFQLSLHASLDPEVHLAAGEALTALREQGVLIIGSGLSYHNLPDLMRQNGTRSSAEFDGWLNSLAGLPAAVRRERLAAWVEAPSARAAHPREEHLLPLMVVAAAGGNASMQQVFHDRIHGHEISGFQFG